MQDLEDREQESGVRPGRAGAVGGTEGSCAVGGDARVAGVSPGGRAARAVVGLAALGVGGALATRALPGRIALWPAALVPSWFGISHLVAAMVGYNGCPELGAIPTVMHGRPIGSRCRMWSALDARLASGER